MSTERPPPDRKVPEGYELVAVVSNGWRLVTGKRCRRKRCQHLSVAELNRGSYTSKLGKRVEMWFAYCRCHLYGNWIEDGQVMHWILRETADA